MGVALTDVFDALPQACHLGGYYVNDFNRFGRTWQVNVQADALLPRGRGRPSNSSRSAARRRRHGAKLGAWSSVRRLGRTGDNHAL